MAEGIKILHVAETIKGGVATVINLLMKSQRSTGSYSQVMCLVPSNQVVELDVENRKLASVFQRRGRSFGAFFSLMVRLVVLLWMHRPDVVHLHSTFAGAFGRIVVACFRLIGYKPVVVYCPHAFSFLMEGGAARLRFYVFIEKVLCKFCDKIICVSEYERLQAIALGLDFSKLICVYNGTPSVGFLPFSNPFGDASVNALFVGRFDRQKGFDILEQVMAGLQGQDILLTAIGGIVNSIDVPSFAANIDYKGWLPREDVRRYFQFADVLVMPSRWEGFAMVALEAMSHGVPVLAFRVGSIPEAVVDGVTGILVDMEDVSALERKLIRTSRDSWKGLGLAAKERHGNIFGVDGMVFAIQNLYLDLLNQGGSHPHRV